MNTSNATDRERAGRWISLRNRDLLHLLSAEQGVGRFVQGARGPARATRIFLSYARPDEQEVADLYDRLCADGFRPWMDRRDILPGMRWEFAIRRAIRDSDFFIACLSPNSVSRRGFLQKEIRIALNILDEMLNEDIYLIPVRLQECEVPPSLEGLQYVDLFKGDGYPKLVQAMGEGMERRKPSPSKEDFDGC